MRSPIRLAFLLLFAASAWAYHLVGDDAGPWPKILGSVGLMRDSDQEALTVIRAGAAAPTAQWLPRIEAGSLVILEGESELATALGISVTKDHVAVRSVIEARRPKLAVIWQRPLSLPVFTVPKDAVVFARERWGSTPLAVGLKRGHGAVLWLAVPPGEQGYERFPYVLQALADLGLQPPLRSKRLWAFFDSSYRLRADLDYLADRWQKAGIAALHVAAWHYWEPDAERDAYLRRLIEACHQRAILVYAWLELPHVSEQFWDEHPAWREKTALGQDAQLDWRKLMNLANRDCYHAVAQGTQQLLGRFDWDGVNLAELYFESLEGAGNPARFTPMNDDVRAEFLAAHGFDPIELFRGPGPADPARLRTFLDFRAQLAQRMQREWIAEVEKARQRKPYLELVLTHVDDRFDTRMRDLIGADSAAILPMTAAHDFTFLVEDPATVWNLGPERYTEITKRYEPLAPRKEKIAIDINIVERYQDVYPTKQQTGTELFQLLHVASAAFPRVAVYFENSLLPPDLPFLASAAASVTRVEKIGPKLVVESRYGVGVPWKGCALVDGKSWPAQNQGTVWLPAGAHSIEPAAGGCPADRLEDFNGELRSAASGRNGIEFSYESASRALAALNHRPGAVEIDGEAVKPEFITTSTGAVLWLPRGQHLVTVTLP